MNPFILQYHKNDNELNIYHSLSQFCILNNQQLSVYSLISLNRVNNNMAF